MRRPTSSFTIAIVEELIASSEAEGRPVCFVVDGDHKIITIEEDKE